MNKATKVIITILIIVVFIIIFTAIVGFRGDAGFTGPGILGLIAFAALIGALKAVWNK
jgi:hypothetical protein